MLSLMTHAHSSLRTHERNPYPCKHLRRLSWRILEIGEVTTCASLLMGTSPTECTMMINLEYSLPRDLKCYCGSITCSCYDDETRVRVRACVYVCCLDRWF